jgi:hypothetical protein
VGFSISSSGSFAKTEAFLRKLSKLDLGKIAEGQAKKGVSALRAATPQESGLAASSWDYEIVRESGSLAIYWTNNDLENGYPVAVMIQYGHGTGTGGYVQGIDYINPAMRPIFDQIADTLWKAVTSA